MSCRRSRVRFLSRIHIFSLSHVRVRLITSLFTTKIILWHIIMCSSFTLKQLLFAILVLGLQSGISNALLLFSLTGFTCDSKHSFQCDNGQCVSKDLVCDSDNACVDNSDEKKCKCYTTQFECPTGECLHVNQLCDSGNDGCHDKTDESRCGEQKLFLDGHVC